MNYPKRNKRHRYMDIAWRSRQRAARKRFRAARHGLADASSKFIAQWYSLQTLPR
jgi:hypothetical protein